MSLRFVAVGLLVASQALAQARPATPGFAPSALPGIHRVGVITPGAPRVSAGLSAAYGYTEPQHEADGAHHRGSALVALAARPLEWLTLGVNAEARYDAHRGGDDGFIADPRLLARVGRQTGRLRYGAQAGAWFPGSERLATTLEGVSPQAELLVAWEGGPLLLGSQLGYRFDRSGAAGDKASRLSASDRLSLGLSDADAVVAGLGASYRLGSTELLLEASADLLVGERAPPLAESPLRLGGGLRHHLRSGWQVQLWTEVSLSDRPPLAADDPLVPVEPRWRALVGAVYVWDLHPRRPPTSAPEAPRSDPARARQPAASAQPPERRGVTVIIKLRDEQGQPVPDAVATLTVGEVTRQGEAGEDGSYRFEDVPRGEGTLTVTVRGGQPVVQKLDVRNEAAEVTVDLRVEAKPRSGQVRGLVRSFGGASLAATIRIVALGVEVKADADGYFEIDVPPGEYEVVIEADGFRTQRRRVEVQSDGVVVLNADLYR